MPKTKLQGACLSACLVLMTGIASAQPAVTATPSAPAARVAAAASAAPVPSAASEAARRDNIKTVDALVKIENTKALEESRKSTETLGFGSASVAQAGAKALMPALPPATLSVDSISGINGVLLVDLSYSGMRYERVRLGSRIGPCEIKTIDGPRVTMVVAPSGSRKKVSADQCPSANWTGIAAPVVDTPALPGMPRMPGGAMPPLPFPAYAPLGYAGVSAQPVRTAPAAGVQAMNAPVIRPNNAAN